MDSDKFALTLMIAFGGLIIAGMMLAGLIWDDKAAFLYALASAVSVWFASFAVMFEQEADLSAHAAGLDRPRRTVDQRTGTLKPHATPPCGRASA